VTNEWDNTPWAGTPVPRKVTLPGLRKAVTGPGVLAYNNPPLSYMGSTFTDKAALFLRAYKVGWFYKAGARITRDIANLAWTLAYEDLEGDNEEEITAPPNDVEFRDLEPLEQFLRLSEHPNPYQTGRALKQKQAIRQIFAGRALWYLENGDGGGLPTALYGISPARMTPSYDRTGKPIGWVMDADSQNPVPFSADEIVVVEEEGAEQDPQGVVEAVYDEVILSASIPRHVNDVLATGGRMAGMLTPKDRTLTEDEFQDALRAWRSVTSDPNAARRLLLFPEPMEYTTGGSSPKEIGIPELATLSRDDILTAFPIAPEMLMVPMATGLNSGETQGKIEERYWEGSIHPRVEMIEDAFQQQLLPRYEAVVGRPLDFDIEEPNRDDAESLLAKTEAYKGLVAIGFDPKEAVNAVGLDHIPWKGLPDLLDPARQAEAQAAQTEALANRPMVEDKPSGNFGKAVKARREDTVGEALPGFEATMREALREQLDRIADDLERVLAPLSKAARKALPDDWWDPRKEDAFLREKLRPLYVRLARSALQVVADDRDKIVTNARVKSVVEQMLDKAGDRITGINETTHEAIRSAVGEGVRRGYSIPQIVNGVADEGFRGLRAEPVFDEARAELIARTETMLAYNESALRGYAEFGVESVEAIDGDDDDECAERNGQVFSVEDALAITDHPNGTLDWVPLT
jgi:hypothetical protein